MNYDQVSMGEAAKLRSLGKNVFYKTSLHPKWHPVTGNTCFTVPQMAGLEFSVERELMCTSKESIKNLVSRARTGSSVANRIISEIAVRAKNGVSTAKEVHNQIIAALYLDQEKPPMKYSIINRELAAVFHSLPLTAGGRTVFGHKHGSSGWCEFIRGVADPSHPPFDDYEFAVQEPVTEELPVQSSDPLTIIDREAATPNDKPFDNYEFAVEYSEDRHEDTTMDPVDCSSNEFFEFDGTQILPIVVSPTNISVRRSEIVVISNAGNLSRDFKGTVYTVMLRTKNGDTFLIANPGNKPVNHFVKLIASP